MRGSVFSAASGAMGAPRCCSSACVGVGATRRERNFSRWPAPPRAAERLACVSGVRANLCEHAYEFVPALTHRPPEKGTDRVGCELNSASLAPLGPIQPRGRVRTVISWHQCPVRARKWAGARSLAAKRDETHFDARVNCDVSCEAMSATARCDKCVFTRSFGSGACEGGTVSC